MAPRKRGRNSFFKERSGARACAVPAYTHMKRIYVTAALLLALPATQAAGPKLAEQGWNTSAELGAIATSGNTVGASISGKIDAKQELPQWSNQYIVSGYFKEDENTQSDGATVRERSAERYSMSAKAAYKLPDDHEKLFVLGSYVDDKFGAYTRYSSMAVGRSTRWYSGPDKSVDVEIGPGYSSGVRANGETENGFTIHGAAALKWQLSDSAVFSQTLSVERGATNIHSSAEAALIAKINGSMHMKAAFIARNDTEVPEDKKNTDTQTSLTLVYSF
ncbi:putative salt-induced outer membrane protein [Oxalobacteraceae bacterium GrIS 1.11]